MEVITCYNRLAAIAIMQGHTERTGKECELIENEDGSYTVREI